MPAAAAANPAVAALPGAASHGVSSLNETNVERFNDEESRGPASTRPTEAVAAAAAATTFFHCARCGVGNRAGAAAARCALCGFADPNSQRQQRGETKRADANALPSKGTKVSCEFRRAGGKRYPGKVSAVNVDGTFDIAYDDGDTDRWVS